MKQLGILCFFMIVFVSCKNKNTEQSESKPVITVSILPQKYFVEKITGDHFNINVMIPPGASPVTYEPTPLQMKELSNSNVYIRIGYIEFEKSWIRKIQNINPDMEMLDQSINTDLIKPEHDHHDHAKHSGHHHGIDPHIWTSPNEVKNQIKPIYQYFIEKYPELSLEFSNNYNLLKSELDSIDLYMKTELAPFQGKKFLIFHPALSYIARDYGLEQISIEIDGKEPTPANIKEIISIAKKEKIKVIFIQQQFSTHNAEVIAKEIDGRVVQIDPLDYNWEQSIRKIVNEIVKSYTE